MREAPGLLRVSLCPVLCPSLPPSETRKPARLAGPRAWRGHRLLDLHTSWNHATMASCWGPASPGTGHGPPCSVRAHAWLRRPGPGCPVRADGRGADAASSCALWTPPPPSGHGRQRATSLLKIDCHRPRGPRGWAGRAGQGRETFLPVLGVSGRKMLLREGSLPVGTGVRGESPGARVPALGQAGHRDPDSCAHASSHRGFLQPVSSTPLVNAGGRLAESSPQGARLSFEDETQKPQSCPLSDSSFR